MYTIGSVFVGIFGFIYFALLDTQVPSLMFIASQARPSPPRRPVRRHDDPQSGDLGFETPFPALVIP